jgi:hypothetical protein
MVLVRERTIPIDRRLSPKLVPTSTDRGVSRSQHGGSPTAVILGFTAVGDIYSVPYSHEGNSRLGLHKRFEIYGNRLDSPPYILELHPYTREFWSLIEHKRCYRSPKLLEPCILACTKKSVFL